MLIEADCLFFLQKFYIVWCSIEVKAGISVEEDWSASRKDGRNYKLSNNSEENPKLGPNYRYVRFLSNGSVVYFRVV